MHSFSRCKTTSSYAVLLLFLQFLRYASVSAQTDKPKDACILSTNTVLARYNNLTDETTMVDGPVVYQTGTSDVFEAKACLCPSQGQHHPIAYCDAKYDACSYSHGDMGIQCFETPKGKQFMKAAWPIAIVSCVIIAAVIVCLWRIGVCKRKHSAESTVQNGQEQGHQDLVERSEGNLLQLMKMGSFRRPTAFKTSKFQKSLNQIRELETGMVAADIKQSHVPSKDDRDYDAGKGRTACLATDDERTVLESELSVNSIPQADDSSVEAQV